MTDTNVRLYPEIKQPFDCGYLNVDCGHKLYYEQCGNPEGKPIIYLHGGPGAGCSPTDRRFFDPEKWRVILFDQRGCGRSTSPENRLYANNTWALVEDIRNILRYLGIPKTAMFAGSWGVALGLAYSIMFPRTVTGMILRGIFLGEKSECDYLYQGGVEQFAPMQWARFIKHVPPDKRNDVLKYYYETMKSGDEATKKLLAYEMAFFEESLMRLNALQNHEIEEELKDYDCTAIGLLEAHYFINDCFMEKGYILDNAPELPDVPITIIQGKYDLVCPPVSAYRLFEALVKANKNVDLFRPLAGHAKSDTEILRLLLSQTNALYDKIIM